MAVDLQPPATNTDKNTELTTLSPAAGPGEIGVDRADFNPPEAPK